MFQETQCFAQGVPGRTTLAPPDLRVWLQGRSALVRMRVTNSRSWARSQSLRRSLRSGLPRRLLGLRSFAAHEFGAELAFGCELIVRATA